MSRISAGRISVVVALTLTLAMAVTLAGCDQRVSDKTHEDSAEAARSPEAAASESESVATPLPDDAQPSFDCSKTLDSSIEELICSDKSLAILDQQMAEVFAAAGKTEQSSQDKYFKARQRGWIKGRNDCWKAQDRHQCVVDSYHQRIMELQVRYGLLAPTGSATYLCDGDKVMASYFATEPRAALASYKGEEAILTIARSASGSRYTDGNVSIWEHQGEATVIWGHDAPEMHCKVQS